MDRILKILKKENGPRASSAPALELNTIIFKHVYWYMQQISGERLQDHWSSGFSKFLELSMYLLKRKYVCLSFFKMINMLKKMRREIIVNRASRNLQVIGRNPTNR